MVRTRTDHAVTTDAAHPFKPDWTLSPGTLIREEMNERGWTEAELASRAGLGPETIAGILAATVQIDGLIAARIGEAFGTSDRMWLNMERIYQEALARGAKDYSGRLEA
jgi:HTH-type transcriptional regulator / antitoxin HigA